MPRYDRWWQGRLTLALTMMPQASIVVEVKSIRVQNASHTNYYRRVLDGERGPGLDHLQDVTWALMQSRSVKSSERSKVCNALQSAIWPVLTFALRYQSWDLYITHALPMCGVGKPLIPDACARLM